MDVSPGIRADVTKVIAAYRRSFGGMGKTLARRRVVEAFHAAGATVVLDLWGGGLSARELMAAGFTVVCVENGSMKLEIGGRKVSAIRKRRAFEIDAMEAGFIPFWGSAADALAAFSDIDAAFLDYCGPWSGPARETINAARHLKIVAVTLMPHHDISTGATSIQERQLAYQLFLRMAWAISPRWGHMSSAGCRILTDYDTGRSQRATVYLLGKPVRLSPLTPNERMQMRTDIYTKRKTVRRDWYNRPENRERIIEKSAKAKIRKGPFDLTCEYGHKFESSKPNGRYCSEDCRHKARMSQQTKRRLFLAQPPKPSTN